MTGPEAPTGAPAGSTDQSTAVRRLDTGEAVRLTDLVEVYEELQMVLLCCERLVTDLAAEEPDQVVVEALWTLALAGYARGFAPRGDKPVVTEEDVAGMQPGTEVVDFHRLLLQLREHHTDPVTSPRERYTVGLALGADGTAEGVAITSARQPMVDDVTVRQTGAIAYALSGVVNQRIEAQQEVVLAEMQEASPADLARLEPLDVAG